MTSNAFSPSKLQIVNNVLSELGRLPVDNVDTDSSAQIISGRIDQMIPLLLLKAPWDWAIKFVMDDTPITQNFSPEFVYSFQLPSDYGRMFRLYNQWLTQYAFIDTLLLSNQKPVQYYYIVNQVDYDVIMPLFERVLVLYVASTVCAVLTQNVELTKYLNLEYKNELSNAILQNDMERRVQTTPFNDYDRIVFV